MLGTLRTAILALVVILLSSSAAQALPAIYCGYAADGGQYCLFERWVYYYGDWVFDGYNCHGPGFRALMGGGVREGPLSDYERVLLFNASDVTSGALMFPCETK